MGLSSVVREVCSLTTEERNAMFRLLSASFENVQHKVFCKELAEKDLAILLYDRISGSLKGFSSQKVFPFDAGGRSYRVVFSGDTIIEPTSWGSFELPLAWGTWMLTLWHEEPEVPLHWMLISQGFRTYRYLPVFFKSFFPRHNMDTPEIVRRLMDDLGVYRYGPQYDPVRGVLLPNRDSSYLIPSLAKVPEERRKDLNVDFFCRSNPDHVRGAELLCLARFDPQNLHPFIFRKLKERMRRERDKMLAGDVQRAVR